MRPQRRLIVGFTLLACLFTMGACMAGFNWITDPSAYFYITITLVGLSGLASALLAGTFTWVRSVFC
jgi:hypothetical protein